MGGIGRDDKGYRGGEFMGIVEGVVIFVVFFLFTRIEGICSDVFWSSFFGRLFI